MNATPVFLRNQESATVLGRAQVPPFALVGRRSNGVLELWQESGAWREDGAEHPLDIVGLVTPSGQLVSLKAGGSPL
ncbi:MAG: hypothetical protein JNK23_10480 [Opitutaceae bacterium]|nr:hypothetical protein [Opitutaceae bacterium]